VTEPPCLGVCASAADAVGWTPLVALDRLAAGLPGRVLVKLESYSPGGSVKDRIARRMVADAVARGALRPGGAIVETTSGNTGIGLAMVAAVRGYSFHAVISAGNTAERRRMLAALGASVVVVPQVTGRPGEVTGEDLEAVERRAMELAEELGAWRPDQFANPSNVAAHKEGTGPEIWAQTGGRVDCWVACVGTCGTFVGVARALKERDARVRCLAVEPASSRPLAGEPVEEPRHRIQGTGYSFVPPQWDPAVCDGYLSVADHEAEETARRLASQEGIFAGYSSGANVRASLRVAREAPPGTVVVTVAPDTGLRYLSTPLFP